MKFNIAAAAIAATSSFVGVHASTTTSKSGKGSCSSSPKLEKFCYEEPANFEGTYKLCYENVLREAKTGPTGVTFRFCSFVDPPGSIFKKLDEYCAYEVTVDSGVGILLGGTPFVFSYQGIAQGNSIKMTTYGGGAANGNGDIILPNETPDTSECTLYDEGILKCISYFQEYCGPNANETVLPSDCEVGEWLMSYTIEEVFALEGSDCPPAPEGFCPDGPSPGFGRKLQEEEVEKNEVSPCPFMNKKMN